MKLWAPIQHFYTLFVVIIGWVFFRADDLEHALQILRRMFVLTLGEKPIYAYLDFFYLNTETVVIFLLAIIFSMPAKKHIATFFTSKVPLKVVNALKPISLIFLFVLSIAYITSDSYLSLIHI